MSEIPLKYSMLSTAELIREVEHSDNELAKALLYCMEAGTPAVEALSTALAEAHTNVETFLEKLGVVLEEEQFDNICISEQIEKIIEPFDEKLSSDCLTAIENMLKQERQDYEEALADVWLEELLTQKEGQALKLELDNSVEDSSAWYDLPVFWNTKADFHNPFQNAKDAKQARENARKQAEKERLAAIRATAPKAINKRRKRI